MRTSEIGKVQDKEVKNEGKVMAAAPSADSQSLGELKIHENVISSLVRRATLAQEGVSRLSGNNFVDTIGEIVGSRRMQARAINVTVDEETRITIEIKLNLVFGCQIPQVAARVQQEVIKEVEKTTGMTVKGVDVLVQDMEEYAPAPEAETEY